MEPLKHECGIALIRLRKSTDYFRKTYGDADYALGKLYLMMEKQHNRGQEGAGIAVAKLNTLPGHEYMFREKAEGKEAISRVFDSVYRQLRTPDPDDPSATPAFHGELLMGHLRYSTTGKGGLRYVHPFLRRNNWRAKNLCLCGNFNMTNIAQVFSRLTKQGQYPRVCADTYILLELMGHRLDREVERCYQEALSKGMADTDITHYIDEHVDMANVLRTTMPLFDGGYVMAAMTGSGEMFVMRDPWGIRPCFYYISNELVSVASERPVLQTTFDVNADAVHELLPGQALLINSRGDIRFEQIIEPANFSACCFERIYFSRGNDQDIYRERKQLGGQLAEQISKAVDGDLAHTVVSYIPNTAETAYIGLCEALRDVYSPIRMEKVVTKDIKLRTFITESGARNDLAAHVYDITTGVVKPHEDNLVVIDDSIVRGTTLRESIIKILDRLHPKKMIIVSSAPQIRYPDFYGIDMSNLSDFIAFQACISLLEETGQWQIIHDTYHRCVELVGDLTNIENPIRALYAPFTVEELNSKMVELLRPMGVATDIELVFQSIEGLHAAIPNHPGDWYFTGNYPTPGGCRLICQSFIDYYKSQYGN